MDCTKSGKINARKKVTEDKASRQGREAETAKGCGSLKAEF